MNTHEVYVSTDIEADGPIPGPHSMLSFASAAYLADKTLIGTFSANLDTLPGASGSPETMAWWAKNQAAWQASRMHCQPPEKAMRDYVDWLAQLPGKPVFVAYPAAFDFMFVQWYLMRFAGESPFSHSALDIKTLAMALLNTDYREATKRNMPREWFDDLIRTSRSTMRSSKGHCSATCCVRCGRGRYEARNRRHSTASDFRSSSQVKAIPTTRPTSVLPASRSSKQNG